MRVRYHTHECDNEMQECDNDMHECDLYTQSVISTRIVILTRRV
jgi:hypothetical protein